MTQVVDKKPADPILVDLSNRFNKEYNGFQTKLGIIERKRKNVQRALSRELYALVGLKPKDKVMYQNTEYIVEGVDMPYLAEDENVRADVYVTMHKTHCTYSIVRLLSNVNEQITKL